MVSEIATLFFSLGFHFKAFKVFLGKPSFKMSCENSESKGPLSKVSMRRSENEMYQGWRLVLSRLNSRDLERLVNASADMERLVKRYLQYDCQHLTYEEWMHDMFMNGDKHVCAEACRTLKIENEGCFDSISDLIRAGVFANLELERCL